MRSIWILILLINTGNLFSQIVVVDTNNLPIPFVQIISSNKHFFAQSTLKGTVNNVGFTNLKANDTLFFHHVSYENAFRIKRDLSIVDTIRLKRKSYELKEFAVSARETNKNYRKISACYRGFQVNNDSVAYYSDGKVEYVTKTNKHNYENFRKEYRSFANKRLEADIPHRSVGVTYVVTGVPYPPYEYLPAHYSKKHKLTYVSQANERKAIMNQDNIQLGEIEKNAEYIKYSFNDISSLGSRKLLKTEVNTLNIEVIMLFKNNGIEDEKMIENFDDLLYIKILREVQVKHDKDKKYTNIMSVNELFIEDVWYSESIEKADYINRYGMPKNSKYNSEFWKNCNCKAYYPPDERIIKGLYER